MEDSATNCSGPLTAPELNRIEVGTCRGEVPTWPAHTTTSPIPSAPVSCDPYSVLSTTHGCGGIDRPTAASGVVVP